ncbi:hypothetical protein KKE06_04625 [Candidatus Micrarchaeota archaeon]|nr:hypothetical protein [Candidatus Micrarchaeota archaeon]MBU1930532.1 hypothetical protein [Candidatus Micrarchaeota archaeon]
MVSSVIQISELKYQIRGKQREIEHLNKVLDRKRKNGLLSQDSERGLLDQQEQLFLDIQDIEQKIRGMENEEARKKNLRE